MNSTQWTRLAVAAVLGLAWLAIVWFGKTAEPGMLDIVAAIKLTLAGVVGHLMGDSGNVQPVPSKINAQAGRVMLSVLIGIAAIAMLTLSGCTTTTGSMYSGLYTQAKAGVQVFDDNTLHTARDIICAQPYSAIQRNSDLQPGILVLCGPLANANSLDAGQLQLLMNVVGKAQAAGLLAVPAAAAASGSK